MASPHISDPSTPALKREFSLWSSFAFAFAFISPIVALYGIFGLAIAAAGPSFWWGFLLVFVGQLLVAISFAVLVSRWPIEGSIYQWSRRLLGTAYGWFGGWTYAWTLVITMATVALGAAGFIANILGNDAPTSSDRAIIALVILLCGTALNLVGRGVLKLFMTASIVAEIVGSLGLGTWLLVFHRHQPLSVLLDGTGAGLGHGYLAVAGPFWLAVGFIGYSFVGFESAGSIAEEVHQPRKVLPKAVVISVSLVAAVVIYSSLAIILAIPDMSAVTSGAVADPVYGTLTAALGSDIAKPVELLFVIGFLASFLALQTSASRMIWAFARDRALPGADAMSRLSRRNQLPTVALLVTTGLGCVLLLLSNVASDLYSLMVNFSAGGFFLSFAFPLVGLLVVQLGGRWTPGAFTAGKASLAVTVVATIWAIFQFLNISWPRSIYPQRWLDWSVWIMIGVLGVAGAVVFLRVRGRIVVTGVTDEDEEVSEAIDDSHTRGAGVI